MHEFLVKLVLEAWERVAKEHGFNDDRLTSDIHSALTERMAQAAQVFEGERKTAWVLYDVDENVTCVSSARHGGDYMEFSGEWKPIVRILLNLGVQVEFRDHDSGTERRYTRVEELS